MATHPLPASVAAARPGALVRLLPRPATLGRDVLYLCAGLPTGVVAFSVLVTGFSLAAGLAVTLLGIPVMLGTLIAARFMGDVERRRAGWVLGAPIARSDRRWSGGVWARTCAAFTDSGAWRDLTWGLVLLPLGILGFTVAVTVWASALGLLTSAAWYWSIPEDGGGFLNSHGLDATIVRTLAGVALIPVAAWTCRVLADFTARGARALLAH
jgi:hypothetical protein